MEVTPPSEPRSGAPAPARGGLKKGGLKKPAVVDTAPAATSGSADGEEVKIPKEKFVEIMKKLRTNELLGAEAADQLEVAAGLKDNADSSSPKTKELRKKVAGCRMGEAETIPDAPSPPPKKRASLSDEAIEGGIHDAEEEGHEASAKDAPEPPELNLNPKQNKMRTDLEMWVMDELPVVYGVDDSDELAEELQEDGQADKITFVIAEKKADAQKELLQEWLTDPPSADAANSFMQEMMTKVKAIHEAGKKKKKKE